jgi:predicted Fe-Mo cluster-binding NifX family protein
MCHGLLAAGDFTLSDHAATTRKKGVMKIAVPVCGTQQSLQFGHCHQVALFDVNCCEKRVVGTKILTPPAGEEESWVPWLEHLGADIFIADGMPSGLQHLFNEHHIKVLIGASFAPPDLIINAYLHGSLNFDSKGCDH